MRVCPQNACTNFLLMAQTWIADLEGGQGSAASELLGRQEKLS